MRLKHLLLCLLLPACVPLAADPLAVSAVNEMRQAAGLQLLTESAPLTEAAAAHAVYLQRYMPPGSEQQASAHEERAGLPEFSGYLAPDRAVRFGYPHAQVLENVSLGNPDIRSSVADLMSAIYHRFAFLDFSVDEIGAASVAQRYVYNMGHRGLAQTCQSQVDAAKPARAYNCLGTRMNQADFEAMCRAIPAEALFEQPFNGRCSNGKLLNRNYMAQVCNAPSGAAKFKGSGRYYPLCENGNKIDAGWFDRLCAAPPEAARYEHSASVYKICQPERKVHADWFESYCANLPESVRYTASGRYYDVCENGFQISSEYYQALQNETLAAQPEAVLWPVNGVRVKPVFYSEEPHPTPDLPMTGYPVSIQFNPQKVESAVITVFLLERYQPDALSDWKPLSDIRRIDRLNDVNQRFSELEFAWFPLQRLAWGARYRYRIEALLDGVAQSFASEFETTRLDVPVYTLEGGVPAVQVATKRFVLYRPPDSYDATPFQGINLRYRNRPYVEANVIDANTVEITAGGRGCSPVYLSTRLEEEIRIDFCKQRKWLNLF